MADGPFLSVRTLAGQRHSVALPQDPSATIADLKALLGRECSETLRHCRLLHNVRAPRVKTCCCMPTRSRLKVSIGPVVVGAGLLSGGLEDGGLLGAAPGAVPGGSLPCLGRRGVAGSSPPPALLLSFPRCRWPWKPRRLLAPGQPRQQRLQQRPAALPGSARSMPCRSRPAAWTPCYLSRPNPSPSKARLPPAQPATGAAGPAVQQGPEVADGPEAGEQAPAAKRARRTVLQLAGDRAPPCAPARPLLAVAPLASPVQPRTHRRRGTIPPEVEAAEGRRRASAGRRGGGAAAAAGAAAAGVGLLGRGLAAPLPLPAAHPGEAPTTQQAARKRRPSGSPGRGCATPPCRRQRGRTSPSGHGPGPSPCPISTSWEYTCTTGQRGRRGSLRRTGGAGSGRRRWLRRLLLRRRWPRQGRPRGPASPTPCTPAPTAPAPC